jgi:hypothetical protein
VIWIHVGAKMMASDSIVIWFFSWFRWILSATETRNWKRWRCSRGSAAQMRCFRRCLSTSGSIFSSR